MLQSNLSWQNTQHQEIVKRIRCLTIHRRGKIAMVWACKKIPWKDMGKKNVKEIEDDQENRFEFCFQLSLFMFISIFTFQDFPVLTFFLLSRTYIWHSTHASLPKSCLVLTLISFVNFNLFSIAAVVRYHSTFAINLVQVLLIYR